MGAEKLSDADTIALVTQKVKEDGDSLWLKVFRRRNIGAMPDAVATFSDAQAIHVQYPETWLPRIAGGGPVFMISVYHSSAPTIPIGSMIQISVPTDGFPPKGPNEIDFSMLKAGDWNGPKTLVWPNIADRKAAQQQSTFSIPPPTSSAGHSAANSVSGTGGQSGVVSPEWGKLEAEKERLNRFHMEMLEQKRTFELENLRRESEARHRELESRLLQQTQQLAVQHQAPKTDPMQIVAAIGAAFGPVIQQMIAGQNETRQAVMRQQEQAAILQQQIQAQAAERQQQMFQMMLARPTIDPAVAALLDKSRSGDATSNQMFHNMANAMGVMTQTTMDLVQTAAEMNLGGGRSDESGGVKALKEGIKAINSIFQGYQAAAPKPPPALPPQAQLTPHQQYVQQATEQHQAQQAQAQQPPVAPAPGAPPAPVTVLDRLEGMIKAKQPVGDVAKAFIDAFVSEDDSLHSALEEVNGSVDDLVAKRVGTWGMADQLNAQYLEQLRDEVNKRGQAAGIFEAEEEDSGDDDSDE